MKSRLLLITMAILVLGSLSTSPGLANEEVNVWFDGKLMQFDVPAMLLNGRTMVPMRRVFEAFGAEVRWEEATSTVNAFTDKVYVSLKIDDPAAWLGNDQERTASGVMWSLSRMDLDVAPVIRQGRTLIPLRFVSEALGAQVKWDGPSRIVTITSAWVGKYDPYLSTIGDIASSASVQSDDSGIGELALQITAGLTSSRAKALAVHDWVAQNVAYDTYTFLNPGDAAPQDALSVLRSRIGVCAGYSNLAAALLRSIGVPVRVVPGWARGNRETWAELLRRSPEANHAWNEVLVDGRWLAMDVTWDAGSVDGDKFTPRFSRAYFNLDPDLFGTDHSTRKPAAEPAGLTRYYFSLSPGDQKAVSDLALDYVKDLPEFLRLPYPKYTAWEMESAVGYVEGGSVSALFLANIYHLPETRNYFQIRLERQLDGSWRVSRATTVTADFFQPTGGFELK